ncbi:hypothetical protein ACFSHT_24070 [Paraburkholderia silviterrae]|nr:hypothetical protein [Paraburkholderia silviterrae]
MQGSEIEEKELVPFALDEPGAGMDEGVMAREVGEETEGGNDR